MRGKQVIPAEEHAVKIRAARDAIGDADFFLVARTDARATSAKTGLEEAIYRANLYMEVSAPGPCPSVLVQEPGSCFTEETRG